MKQYMSMEHHKWGFKLFILAGISGYAYTCEIYSGEENSEIFEGELNLGLTSKVVLRWGGIIPRQQNNRLYHDNYYTSVPLMLHLANEGIY